ncbi:MAG: ShlB/FhaC/HecB family hemolysin secretion/activation protein [Candidatus Omnitrophota bacterium]
MIGITTPAFAANIPPGQEPGAQGERVYQQFEQRKELLGKKKVKAPEIEVEKPKGAAAPSAATFLLKEISVTGSTVFKPQDLRPTYQAYLDKKISFQDLDEITKKIEDRYVRKGYLTTTVFVPEQDIKGGKVEVKVVEGRLGKVTVEGNRWFSRALIEKFLHIKKEEPLNMPRLQKDILRLNQNPDLEIKTFIQAGEVTGTSDIVLRAKENVPYHIGAGFDNQGTRLTGKNRTSFYLRSSNLTGHFDSFFASNILSADTVGVSSSYDLPLDTRGTMIGMDMTYFTMTLGKELRSFHVTGTTQIYSPHISKELYLSESFQANASAGMEIKVIKKKIAGAITTNDQLRLPYFGFDLNKTDLFGGGGETTFSPQFTFGTSRFLGASTRNHPSASRDGTGGFFFNYTQNLRRMQRMFLKSYMAIRSVFQVSPYTLPSSEQCQLGGINTVRGYPEGDYMADIGGNISTDWMFPAYFIPERWKLPKADVPLRSQIEPFVFLDVGMGKLNKTLQGEREHKFLMGSGGGVQLHFRKNLYVRAQWAKALGDDPTSGAGASTFYITCQVEI